MSDQIFELARMWEARDPVPDDLADRILVSLAVADLDAEFELLTLVAGADLAGVRSAPPEQGELTSKLEFTNGRVTVVLRIASDGADGRRVDGWVSPDTPMTVRLRTRVTGVGGETLEAPLEHGRFEFLVPRGGMARIWLIPDSDDPTAGGRAFATALFEI